MATVRVGLEVGETWIFASALDWPGWCRRGKGEQAAIDALLAYRDRYSRAVGAPPPAGDDDIEVAGRVSGGGVTDFGAPGVPGPWDEEPLPAGEAERQVQVLEACWRAFDAVVAAAPGSLRKGPRGGGRDRDAIAEHVRQAERAYGRKLGVRLAPSVPWAEQRAAIASRLLSAGSGDGWSPRYGLRRVAWHVLDHAWEIQDRSQ